MNTLNLKQAAVLLKMTPAGLRRLAADGKIPAAKPGKYWCFIEEDLVDHLRSLYPMQCKVSQGDYSERRKKLCHSISETISGGYALKKKKKEYEAALKPLTK